MATIPIAALSIRVLAELKFEFEKLAEVIEKMALGKVVFGKSM